MRGEEPIKFSMEIHSSKIYQSVPSVEGWDIGILHKPDGLPNCSMVECFDFGDHGGLRRVFVFFWGFSQELENAIVSLAYWRSLFGGAVLSGGSYVQFMQLLERVGRNDAEPLPDFALSAISVSSNSSEISICGKPEDIYLLRNSEGVRTVSEMQEVKPAGQQIIVSLLKQDALVFARTNEKFGAGEALFDIENFGSRPVSALLDGISASLRAKPGEALIGYFRKRNGN